jgi:hypothetical protein
MSVVARGPKRPLEGLVHAQIQAPIRKIAFLASYRPRKCGIATFTADLRCAMAAEFPAMQCLVVPVNDVASGYDYPAVVRFEIAEQDLPSYLRAADFLNITDVDVVCVQHEFGIFGGPAGSHLLALLRELRMSIVTTLHTILREPSPEQARVMRELVQLSTRLVVMAERGRKLLCDVYGAPASQIDCTSGTLAYAFGAGNAVVSTPYWHVTELLTEDRGKLVPFRDPAAPS